MLRAALVALLTAASFLPVHTLPIGAWLVLIYVIVLLLNWALLFNAASYVFSYFVIRSARVERSTTRSEAEAEAETSPAEERSGVRGVGRELVEGLRVFAHSRYLVTLLVMLVILMVGTTALNGLDVYFVTENLHANPHLYGLLSMADGAGMILGSLVSGVVVKRLGIRQSAWPPLVPGGLLLLLFARQTHFWSALVLVVLGRVVQARSPVCTWGVSTSSSPLEQP